MNALFPIIEQMVINGLMNKKPPFMRKNKFGLGLAILSGLLFLTALSFAIIGVYGWLMMAYSQPVAAMIVCVGVLTTSLLIGLGSFLLLKSKPSASTEHGEDITALVTEMAGLLGEELTEPIQANPKTAVLLAGLAGYVAGERLH